MWQSIAMLLGRVTVTPLLPVETTVNPQSAAVGPSVVPENRRDVPKVAPKVHVPLIVFVPLSSGIVPPEVPIAVVAADVNETLLVLRQVMAPVFAIVQSFDRATSAATFDPLPTRMCALVSEIPPAPPVVPQVTPVPAT